MSDYSFSSEGASSDDDRDSYASEISAFNSGESEPEHESEHEPEPQDVPISATTRSSRRRSARISAEPQLTRAPKIVVIDDSDASDFEEEEQTERYSRAQRQKPRKVHRVKRTLPLALIPEDVPWKKPNTQLLPDPETVENAPSVAFIIIFINTFTELFSDLPPYGPQDIERGVKECTPAIEQLFLRLLGLVLNRKKEIERGRYSSALSELHALLPLLGVGLQFPLIDWKSKTAFEDLVWEDRLELLHVLIHWSLANSERVRLQLSSLDDSSTMPWIGMDNDNCRYYLVRGESLEENRDTEFRVYKETNRLLSFVSWRAVAATPQEVSKLAQELQPQGKSAAKLGRQLADMVSELEESEDRRFKEARRQRRRQDIEHQTMQVLQGEGRYSGRTRGRRVDYSQLSYDRELDAAMRRSSRRSGRVDGSEEWSETAGSSGPTGDRQSRRLRGEVTMDIEQVEKELEAAEARGRKRGREQAEKERLEQERLEELEKERLEKESLVKERIEKERLEKERLEKERLEKERLEKERLEKERLEKERATNYPEPQVVSQVPQTLVPSVYSAQTEVPATVAKAEPSGGISSNNTNIFGRVQTTGYQNIDQQSHMSHSIANVAPGSSRPSYPALAHASTANKQIPQLASQARTHNTGQNSPPVNSFAQHLPVQIMNLTPPSTSAGPPVQSERQDPRNEYMMRPQWPPAVQSFNVPSRPSNQALPGLNQLSTMGRTIQMPPHVPTSSHPPINQGAAPQLVNLPASQSLMAQQQFQYYPGMQMQAQMQYQQPYNSPSGTPNGEKKHEGSGQEQS
ncbi:hypothetical protein B9G98_01064 [Wickerhamiella sorbophila]|uniref:WHIM1 domain-containing protein n=1 Tax=Wickerhamiella sorbophila TaxID=45607 RepID=A0A2T0FEP0_9ASCO|nr:hypothetical protein B9G98_01064 [Wickerhamiella sorbophila]PRT53444.1 hypothetical protein B9G98_01064 [Wickerhamiella sorbophila]